MVYDLACGGCSIIKDDHNLFNQTYAPFEERVRACVEAVNAAYEDSGNRALYVANCNGDGEESIQRAWKARELGADGVMISPGLCGFGPLFRLSSNPDFSLPLFLHPSFAGPLTASDEAGITPFCYFGQLARLSGADASVFSLKSERPAIIQAIKEAREEGDLRENAGYDAARERQGMAEARIKYIESRMALYQVAQTSR